MVTILVKWLVNALAIFCTGYILQNGVHVANFQTAIILALVLGILNAVIKPILIILTLPLTFLSLGLFVFILNALLVLLADVIIPDFTVANFWWALLFSIVLSLINSFLFKLSDQR